VRVAPVGARRPGNGARRPVADVRAELGAGDRPLVVAAGRLTEQKGYDVLVAAARTYELRTPRPLTAIAGDGPLRATLAEAAEAAGVDLMLLGHRDDVPDLLLVASNVGGLPELLGGGAATLVPPDDPTALAAAVNALLDDPRRAAAQAAAGRQRAEEWPDEDEAVRRVLALYATLATPPPGAPAAPPADPPAYRAPDPPPGPPHGPRAR
jgi:glycosyltransferase involved in cell wall biosynthesis